MTVANAIKEGYTHFGSSGFPYQGMMQISTDIYEHTFNTPKYLFTKDPTNWPDTDEKSIREVLADHINNQVGDETGDDTDDVYDIIMGLDLSETARIIKEALSHKKYYSLTNIQLIP